MKWNWNKGVQADLQETSKYNEKPEEIPYRNMEFQSLMVFKDRIDKSVKHGLDRVVSAFAP